VLWFIFFSQYLSFFVTFRKQSIPYTRRAHASWKKSLHHTGALHRSYLGEFLPLEDLHHLHTFAGIVVGVEVMSHSFWHLLRWGLGGELHLLWGHVTGRSGLLALLITPLLVWPMTVQRLRKTIAYEWRKTLHYLRSHSANANAPYTDSTSGLSPPSTLRSILTFPVFSVVWALALCWHAPARHIAIIMGSAIGIYLADWIYGFCFQTYLVPSLHFHRLGSAVEVSWENPPGFVNNGAGYRA
jgi:hypothetical protein